jgi:hypothetical protein
LKGTSVWFLTIFKQCWQVSQFVRLNLGFKVHVLVIWTQVDILLLESTEELDHKISLLVDLELKLQPRKQIFEHSLKFSSSLFENLARRLNFISD